MDAPEQKNLKLFSKHEQFEALLKTFGVITQGHFEYKKVAEDGTRMRGEYFMDFRSLTTAQEQQLAPMYGEAIQEFFAPKMDSLIIVGVAYATIAFAKTIQLHEYGVHPIEYAYSEKREGKLGLFDAQAKKCRGKHILFIEDICNNGASLSELSAYLDANKETLGYSGYSVLYGVHRGHAFPEAPKGEVYAMCMIYAPSYHVSELPPEIAARPLKAYKK